MKALLAGLIAGAVGLTGLAAPSPGAAIEAFATDLVRKRCAKVKVIGHRGIGGPHENTIKGFRRAARGGADVVETDVWLTRDNVPVLIHDATWRRTTNWRGRVSRTRYSVVRKRIRTDGGDRIPTLGRALRWSARSHVGLMVDVKWAPRMRPVARKIKRLGVRKRVSFYMRPHRRTGKVASIDRAHALNLRTGIKTWYGRWPMTPKQLRKHGGYVVTGHHRAERRKYVRRMHRARLKVYPKGSTRNSWPALLRAGVDGLTVPNPRRYRTWCRRR